MRKALAQITETCAFAMIAAGVYLSSSLGPALIVGGILLALEAIQIERAGGR